MVVTYLEKIRDKFLEEKINIDARLTELMIIHKENMAFVEVLEQNNDVHFEAFTPRNVNTFHKRKIDELKEEQIGIEEEMDILKLNLDKIEKEIEEVSIVIKIAKENSL